VATGKDFTQSSLRDTQAELERLVPVSVLSDAVFHGQHLVTGLLEKTDKDFKTALDNIIATDVWLHAQEIARDRRKEARAAREQLVGRIMEKDEQEQPLQEALADTNTRVEAWRRETTEARDVLAAQLRQVHAAAERDGLNVSTCREELAAAQHQQAEQQRALDALLDAISEARRSFETRRAGLEQQATKASDTEALCKSRVELMAARTDEIARAREREAAAEQRARALDAKAAQWQAKQHERVGGASHALNRALASCEALRRGLAEAAESHDVGRLALVKALNVSIMEVEAAAALVAASEEAASAAQARAAQYAELEHEPSCRVCLQPIDARAHASHLVEMEGQVQEREQVLHAARARFQEAQLQRRRAHGLLDG
jgi:DNA repair exonuclease SbcCD ATPase subunit